MNRKLMVLLFTLVSTFSVYSRGTHKNLLVEAFIHVESENNDKAVNPRSKAVGCLQITPAMVMECNRLVGKAKYKLADRENRRKSVELFHLIMRHRNPGYDLVKACRIWNPNGGYRYQRKIQNKYNELLKSK